jgi:hypothetical protein
MFLYPHEDKIHRPTNSMDLSSSSFFASDAEMTPIETPGTFAAKEQKDSSERRMNR